MTDLYDITVRYEDEDGAHVDWHTAAYRSVYDDETVVETGVCACCDDAHETHRYNDENVVKIEEDPVDHHELPEYDGLSVAARLLIAVILLIVVGLACGMILVTVVGL